MRIFLDSSALAKRYLEELGSDQVARRCQEADEIVLSVLCVPELISGFNRLRREGAFSPARYRALKGDLAADVEEASVIDLTAAVIDRAIVCLERARLRALDAIQVACAIESGCDVFLTADRAQGEAARRLRVKTEMIGSH